jgi:iron(III) transport system ATP-binding protein
MQPILEDAPVATADSGHAYLRIRDLTKRFGTFTALKNISLDVRQGEFVCFLGPSGCGKTTLLRAIAGLDVQTEGTIEQGGRDISTLPPAQRDFGIVFQSYALFPNLTIDRNIAYGLENKGMARRDINVRVAELLKLVGMPEQGIKYPAQLSGGQQQRVALARALATSPGLLLLDEPLSALDAKVRVHLRHEVRTLQERLGVTTIMVTHDQEEALTMADRIVVMNQGVIEQIGTPDEVYRDPRSLFVAEFIGEMNRIAAVVVDSTHVEASGAVLGCAEHDLSPGTPAVVTLRPEDIVPHVSAAPDGKPQGANMIDATLSELEFLGASWRAYLESAWLPGQHLIGAFSANAVRRLSLEEGMRVTLELPSARMQVFPRPETAQ